MDSLPSQPKVTGISTVLNPPNASSSIVHSFGLEMRPSGSENTDNLCVSKIAGALIRGYERNEVCGGEEKVQYMIRAHICASLTS